MNRKQSSQRLKDTLSIVTWVSKKVVESRFESRCSGFKLRAFNSYGLFSLMRKTIRFSMTNWVSLIWKSDIQNALKSKSFWVSIWQVENSTVRLFFHAQNDWKYRVKLPSVQMYKLCMTHEWVLSLCPIPKISYEYVYIMYIKILQSPKNCEIRST